MSKDLIKKYFGFILLIILIDLSLGYSMSYFAQAHKLDLRIPQLINNELKSELYVIGSSHALNDYDCETIEKNTGIKSFNLGFSGSNILFHETIFDLVLKNKTLPKYIIYNIDDHACLYEYPGIQYRLDAISPYVYDPFINELISEKLDKNIFATYCSKSFKHNVNFVDAVKYCFEGVEKNDLKTNNIDKYGANLITDKAEYTKVEYIKNSLDLTKLKPHIAYIESFKRIQQKCKAKNIELIFSIPPRYGESTIGFKQKIDSLNITKSIFIDNAQDYSDSTLFYDAEHLNNKGATIFTKSLISKIQSKNGF